VRLCKLLQSHSAARQAFEKLQRTMLCMNPREPLPQTHLQSDGIQIF